jgi:hypothetical protein
VSDQLPPGGPGGLGGPDEDRPPPLIPSRAARHQPKRGRLLRGRSARPAKPPEPSGRERPEPSGRPGPEPSAWQRPEPSAWPPAEPSARPRP